MINNIKKGFTLAEVLIVLTILGIIAAISMTTLRPAEFKAKGMDVAAKKVLYDIDVATTEILLDFANAGTTAVIPDGNCTPTALSSLYKGKLSAIRRGKGASCDGIPYNETAPSVFFLKSGACLAFVEGSPTNAVDTRFPGENENASVTYNCGLIHFDTNGDEPPGQVGADVFLIPLDTTGIKYAD